MLYSIDKNYEEVFTASFDGQQEEQERALDDRRIKKYRRKTIKSGDVLEVETYPIWNTSPKGGIKAAKENISREKQKDLNEANARKHFERLLNENFTMYKDIWATFTYDSEHLPETAELSKRDMQNYIRRAKTYIENNGLPEMKYAYVTEFSENEETGKIRVHHHIVMNICDRDVAEALWTKGGRRQTRTLQPDEFGLKQLAGYLVKDPKGKKRFSTSKNLKRPMPTTNDNSITKKKANQIARNQNSAKEYFEKQYKGYRFVRMEEPKYSDFVSGVYLRVRMIKIQGRWKK